MEGKHVGPELRKLSNLIAREVSRKMRDVPPDRGATEMHINIINYLMRSGESGAMQKEIEEAFTVRKSTASRILTLMEKKGIIERRGVDYDARVKRIMLTPDARERFNRLERHVKELDRRIVAGIPEQDMKIFFAVIERMQNNLRD